MNIVHNSKSKGKKVTDVVTEVPKVPSYFNGTEKRNFKRIAEILISEKALKKRHIPTMEIFSVELAQYEWAVKEIHKKNRAKAGTGFVQKFPTGAVQVSPYITVKEKALKQIFICLRRFGMDPKSEKELEASNQLKLPLGVDDFLGKKSS